MGGSHIVSDSTQIPAQRQANVNYYALAQSRENSKNKRPAMAQIITHEEGSTLPVFE
jgi:hypothetical protein